MKRRPVIYGPEAGTDLDWIYDTVANASDPVTASRYERRIRAFCDGFDHASERGHRRDDIRPGLRIVGFERRVTMAFTVDEGQVTILRIYYGGRNWEEDFQ